jgi:hypothetical protein
MFDFNQYASEGKPFSRFRVGKNGSVGLVKIFKMNFLILPANMGLRLKARLTNANRAFNVRMVDHY